MFSTVFHFKPFAGDTRSVPTLTRLFQENLGVTLAVLVVKADTHQTDSTTRRSSKSKFPKANLSTFKNQKMAPHCRIASGVWCVGGGGGGGGLKVR